MKEIKPDQIKIHIERDIFLSNLLIYLTKTTPEGTFIGRISWEEVNEFMRPEKSTFEVSDERFSNNSRPSSFVRTLMESLENIGLFQKQPEARMLEGELKATNNHLEDMRSLVFSKFSEGTKND